MKKIITSDGSCTFQSTKVDETYHSVSGAKEEAVKKYAEPCRIAERTEVTILDVCFGLGYNSAAALDAFKGKHIEIIGLENDPEILDAVADIDYPFQSKEIILELTKERKYVSDRVSAELIIGDARETIKKLPEEKFDVVFFDPFSPKKAPELWTSEFFTSVYRVMKKGGILATYSCARSVRNNLNTSGFAVQDGPAVGRRSPSTLALKPQNSN